MKLVDAVIMGRFCGLNTVEECILNVEIHYWYVIPYTEIKEEKIEFYSDIKAYETGTLELDWDYINSEVEKQHKEYEAWHKDNVSDPEEDIDWELDLFR